MTTYENKFRYARIYINKWPKEFTSDAKGLLYCNICCRSINPDRKSTVDRHRRGKIHQNGIKYKNTQKQTFLTPSRDIFVTKIIKAFTSADIPLYKVENNELKELFNYMQYPLPSRSTLRRSIHGDYINQINEKTRKNLENCKIFLVVDETEIEQKRFINILGGDISVPKKTYALKCEYIPRNISLDFKFIIKSVNECLVDLVIDSKNFYLLITDSASYMKKAARFLKGMHRNLFFYTCLSHLAHNCCMRIKSYYHDTNNLISAMKNLTHKN